MQNWNLTYLTWVISLSSRANLHSCSSTKNVGSLLSGIQSDLQWIVWLYVFDRQLNRKSVCVCLCVLRDVCHIRRMTLSGESVMLFWFMTARCLISQHTDNFSAIIEVNDEVVLFFYNKIIVLGLRTQP